MPRYERGYMAADFGTEISGLSVYRGDMDERRSGSYGAQGSRVKGQKVCPESRIFTD